MKTLKQYLEDTNTPARRFARVVGMSPSYASEIINGKKTPGLKLALDIKRATGGAVLPESFFKSET